MDREFPRQRASVILGAGGGVADLGNKYAVRAALPQLFDGIPAEAWERLPEWTEDSFPGFLLNVAAGRVANRFDLGGVNFTVDAACASSLAALAMARRELESGTSDMAIAGGVDTVQNPFGYLCFSKSQALSPTRRCRTVRRGRRRHRDQRGLAVVVLKRLADAERDGDRIYAVIKGVGGSSDGRGKGPDRTAAGGQMRALRRAYAHAGLRRRRSGLSRRTAPAPLPATAPRSATLLDASSARRAHGRDLRLGLGQVDDRPHQGAAGVAGMIKVALALHHKVLPPDARCQEAESQTSRSRSTLPEFGAAALGGPPGAPRRAGVSSFGFGGTNFHVVLEELHRGPARYPAVGDRRRVADRVAAVSGRACRGRRAGSAVSRPRSSAVPGPACVTWRAPAGRLPAATRAGRRRPQSSSPTSKRCRDALTALKDAIAAGKAVSDPAGAWYQPEAQANGKLAMVFPGQGSQYADIFRDLAVHLGPVRQEIERANAGPRWLLRSAAQREPLYRGPAFAPDGPKVHEIGRCWRTASPGQETAALGFR